MKTRNIILICVLAFAFLLFTAIYALHISGEISDAFKLVNEGLQTSNGSLQEKSDSLFKAAEAQGGETEIASRIKIARDEVAWYRSFIDSLKEEMINRAGGLDENGEVVGKENIDVPVDMMIDEKKGDSLFARMERLRLTLSTVSEDSIARTAITEALSFPRLRKGDDLVRMTFYHVPVTAAITILTKFQNDALSAEQEMYAGALRQMSRNSKK